MGDLIKLRWDGFGRGDHLRRRLVAYDIDKITSGFNATPANAVGGMDFAPPTETYGWKAAPAIPIQLC